MSAVDDYFGCLDASTRAAFEHIQNLVMDMVPDAAGSPIHPPGDTVGH